MKILYPNMLAAIAAVLLLTPPAAQAQAYPSKPVRLVVPFAPGGTTDVLARIVAQKLGASLGQQVIVENKPGANGNIGTDAVAKSPGDGYTLVMSFDGTMAINPNVYKSLPFDPQKDLAPVVNIAQVPLLIVVHPSLKANTIEEFIALAKASPGRINYSSAGHGSTGHLTGELLKARAGIDMTHVPYKGGGQAMQDVLAGQIQMLITALPTAEPYLAGGRLRALAFSSAKRVARLPAVPTLAESGYPGFDVTSWYGILAPASTAPDLVQKLNGEIGQALAQKDLQDRFAALGIEPVGGTPGEFAATIKTDTTRWAKVVKDAGIHLD
ncbi:MAG: tripartite tricarboxylate transporter substrate binding protein [Betaproteobacteria bacterium]